ncbi:RDD family protein [Glaciihabitans sp. UYNi722]|uniref:RDD family protein n=1 Tax=Glaciihabitans sp. UYNi722 TaxID=3156344 RepID=UPI003399964B
MAGPRSSDSAGTHTDAADWPGKRLGLPEIGPRSVGRLGRRIAALAIDGAIADLIAFAFFNYDAWAILAILAILQVVFITLLSGSIGHLLVGLRVVPLASGWIGVWRPALRTVLLCIVVPALIWDRDQRGLHDKIAGTVLVRR